MGLRPPARRVRHPRQDVTAKVTGRDSFAGSIAWVQAQKPNGSWRRIAKVVINQYSVAQFHMNLRPHTRYHLRIYLPKAQAGVGYLKASA
jgi:hypothetical protein